MSKNLDLKRFTATVIEDSETGDLVIPLDPELCEALGWSIGDSIVWEDNLDGTYTLVKKVVDSAE
jgi:hypothetical protein